MIINPWFVKPYESVKLKRKGEIPHENTSGLSPVDLSKAQLKIIILVY